MSLRLVPCLIACVLLTAIINVSAAQDPETNKEVTEKKVKPYKVLTSGKEITIQSKENIEKIIAWTSNGHRFAENNNVNDDRYSFTVPAKEQVVFVMIILKSGKHYTERIGVQ